MALRQEKFLYEHPGLKAWVFTKSPQQSAKTTRLFVLKICRSAICPDQLQEQRKSPERMFVKNPDLTEASWIKDGECFVTNWRTNLSGTEECYSQYLPNIPAKNVTPPFGVPKIIGHVSRCGYGRCRHLLRCCRRCLTFFFGNFYLFRNAGILLPCGRFSLFFSH